MAKAMRQVLCLDEVCLMVSPLNPFKRGAVDLLPDDVRLRLARKAVQHLEGIFASDYEFHLSKPSYTWETLCHLSLDYPDCDFTLLIGADNWLAFNRWAHAQDILDHYAVAVYPREGFPIDPATLPEGVQLLATPLYPQSSTRIRELARAGKSLHGLVPPAIEDEVLQLYGKV